MSQKSLITGIRVNPKSAKIENKVHHCASVKTLNTVMLLVGFMKNSAKVIFKH